MFLKLVVIATLTVPLIAGCSSNPTSSIASARHTYKDCVKNTTEYLVGVTYSCTPKACPDQSIQCADVYHSIVRIDPAPVKSSQ